MVAWAGYQLGCRMLSRLEAIRDNDTFRLNSILQIIHEVFRLNLSWQNIIDWLYFAACLPNDEFPMMLKVCAFCSFVVVFLFWSHREFATGGIEMVDEHQLHHGHSHLLCRTTLSSIYFESFKLYYPNCLSCSAIWCLVRNTCFRCSQHCDRKKETIDNSTTPSYIDSNVLFPSFLVNCVYL